MARSGRSEEGGDLKGSGFPLLQVVILIILGISTVIYAVYKLYKNREKNQ